MQREAGELLTRLVAESAGEPGPSCCVQRLDHLFELRMARRLTAGWRRLPVYPAMGFEDFADHALETNLDERHAFIQLDVEIADDLQVTWLLVPGLTSNASTAERMKARPAQLRFERCPR